MKFRILKEILLLVISILISNSLLGQTDSLQNQFKWSDKYGSQLIIEEISKFKYPCDTTLFKNYLTSKVILPEIDTANYKYSFYITRIEKIKRNQEYKLRIFIKSDPNKIEKILGGIGISIYKLTIKKVEDKYVMIGFEYLYSEI